MSDPRTTTLVALDTWPVRTVRYAAGLIIVSALINLANQKLVTSGIEARDVADSLFGLAIGCTMLTLSFTPMFRIHWRSIAWAGGALIVVCDAVTAAMHRELVMFLVTVMLMIVGTGAILPWSVRWQGSFVVFSVLAWAVVRVSVGLQSSDEAAAWIGVLVAAAIAQAVTMMRERHTREREQSDRQIRESEEKLRKVFEVSSDVITISAEGQYIDVNPAFEITGYTRAEAVGGSEPNLNLWPTSGDRQRFFEQVVALGQVKNLELSFRARDGTLIPCLVSAAKAELQGKPCIIAVSRDITHLKASERELIERREQALAASQAKSEFLSSMSHEIRTPLNTILGMTELLLETENNPERVRYLNAMMDNGNALLGLINDVLDLGRIERGKLTLEKTTFDLSDLIARLTEALGVRAREKELDLTAHIEPDVPTTLVGDPLRLRQVLVNLIGNATKFTERGSVRLTVSREPGGAPGSIWFEVTDTGIGIAPNQLEHIFDSFTQADSSTARKYGGSGLGLSIAKRLAELMGGEMRARSELGRGSTFSFSARFEVGSAPTQLAAAAAPNGNGAMPPLPHSTARKSLRIAGRRFSRQSPVGSGFSKKYASPC
jgi:PAS domain S-box-containing protein